MSVLSDNQITQLCKPYTFMVESSRNQPSLSGTQEEPEKFFPTDRSEKEIKAWIENKTLFVLGDGSNNGAHSAKSYRPLTEEEQAKYNSSGMIYPFCPESLKLTEAGNRALSFGLGSYGYDVRLAEDFKIFSSLNGGIIDPKRLNPDTMVDVKAKTDEFGDKYVILPPNSYLLGSTVETFNIPRDVLCLAIGKSTYARCFTGETKVILADGTTPSFIELIERAETGERLIGYSLDSGLNIVLAELFQPRKISTEKVIEVVLDNGEVIKCTPDHKFITTEGHRVKAEDLKSGDGLFSFNRVNTHGYAAEQASQGLSLKDPALTVENHKVLEIRDQGSVADTFCLTAPDCGNFALASGVFVNNCGLIVNVTPIEPGFQGSVVIEVANTTSLPVKVYADEGIAQFVFFRGTEPCKVSYADKKGKYMAQSGLQMAIV